MKLVVSPSDFKLILKRSADTSAKSASMLNLGPLTISPTRFRYRDRLHEVNIPCSDYTDYSNVFRMVVKNDVGYTVENAHSDMLRRQTPSDSFVRLFEMQHQRGGSVKNWLQSNKSYLYYLVTYPLTNSLRMYVLPGPCLPLYSCSMPLHILSKFLDFHPRSLTFLFKRVPARFRNVCRVENLHKYYIDIQKLPLGARFSLIDRRDPVLHDGSIHTYRYIFIQLADPQNGIVSDVKRVNTMDALNKNEDYDGDQTGDKVARGIESHYEIPYYMQSETMGLLRIRHIFTQNILLRAFMYLTDYARLNVKTFDDLFAIIISPRSLELARKLLDFNGTENGLFFLVYRHLLKKNAACRSRTNVWAAALEHDNTNCRSILDSVVRSCSLILTRKVITRCIDLFVQRVHVLRPEVYADATAAGYFNLAVVMSRSKGTERAYNDLVERDRGAVLRQSFDDLSTLVTDEKMNANRSYLDNFVAISKDVPKNCKLCVGIKWTLQDFVYRKGSIYELDEPNAPFIEDATQYLPPTYMCDVESVLVHLDRLYSVFSC